MKKTNTHIKYGLATAIIFIIALTMLIVTGLEKNRIIFLPHIILLAGVLLNAFAFSRVNKGRVSYGEVLGSCIRMVSIVALAAMAIYYSYLLIRPDLLHASAAFADIADSANKIPAEYTGTVKYALPFSIGMAYLIVGCLFSLVAAAIVKKRKVADSDAAII